MARINFAEVAARRRNARGGISGRNIRRLAQDYPISDFGINPDNGADGDLDGDGVENIYE